MKSPVILLGIFILSCSRSGPKPSTDSSSHTLPPFTVTVVDRSPLSATIQWDAVKNIYNGDTVRYKVKLDDGFVDSNLTSLTDTIHPLIADTSFSGRVYAYTRSGDTVSAPFLLEKLNAFAYFGGGNRVYCYNLISATMVWQSQAAPIGDFTGIPTIVNGVLYENGTESGTWAFNAQTGEKIWNTTFPNDYYRGSSSSPLYVNNILYTIVASGIYALNGSNGTVIWRYPNTVSYATNPIMAGNLLIVGQQSSTSSIIAINAATGVKVWDDTIYTQICKNPVVYNDLVIFGGADGKIYALNQATGSLAWTKNLNVTSDVFGSAIISPVIYHDLVIVHNRTSGYYGLKAFTGATVWNYAIQTTEVSSPAIGNDRVYFSCSEYPGIKAIALDAATGQVIWKHVFGPSGYTPTPIFAHNLLYFAGSIATPSGYGFQVLNANIGADRGLLGPPGPQQFGVETIVAHDTSYYLAESGMVQ